MFMSKTANICASAMMLAMVSMLAGCSKQEPAPAAAVAPATAPASPAAPKWLASTQGEHPGITVAVQELKRGSDTLMLKIAMINQSKDTFNMSLDFTDDRNPDRDIGAIHLIDEANKKKYFVVRDTGNVCLCSRNMPDIAMDAQLVLWAKFPLPPDDVQKINVEVPHFPPMDNVPISH